MTSEFREEFKKRHPTKELSKYFWNSYLCRSDPDVVALFEEWGSERCSDAYADIKVDEIPDGTEFEIQEYDGQEGVRWSIPNDQIIQDLMDVIKGRKKENEVSKFTQTMLENDWNASDLQSSLFLATSRKKESSKTTTQT